ncbi:MAG: hypothetical protein FRX49_09706 [Trebouxia sp. A1-2]|nr:MAG: hypothetical protein FRX49_09706 [Trebouxia sp. A1-2]
MSWSLMLILGIFVSATLLITIWQASSIGQDLLPDKAYAAEEDHLLPATIWWHAPFYSGGGYSSEAVAFMLAMWNSPTLSRKRLWVAQHGDGFNKGAYDALAPAARSALKSMEGGHLSKANGPLVVVCHRAWSVPNFEWGSPNNCPPNNLQPGQAFLVGRTMFETDRLSPERERRCNAMDEIWVPTEFHKQVFADSGVKANKSEAKTVAFLSIFKWELRKGWDVLLAAYLGQFTAADNVALYMKTSPYHSDSNFGDHMRKWAAEHLPASDGLDLDSLPTVYVIDENMAQDRLRRLYTSADCFVLPSRGEGWGRPHVEAMSMGLPVIATNWSGPTAFLDEEVGYPLAIDGLESVEDKGAFEGHMWAAPSVQHLKQLMSHVFQNLKEAQKKGRAARASMIKRFAPPVVAQQIIAESWRIEKERAHREGPAA